jgi:hypothetical protein
MILRKKPINTEKVFSKAVKLKFNLDSDVIKLIDDEVTIAMSVDSTGVYKIGKDVEKYCGIPEKDVIKDVQAGKDRPEDAIIYGLTNIMNNGKDIYFWTNGTRLNGVSKKIGALPAIIEQISHECTHVARLVLTRAIAKKNKVNINGPEWITYDYGAGEYNWPTMGDMNEKNKLIQIDEENFAYILGKITEAITPTFIQMAKQFMPNISI